MSVGTVPDASAAPYFAAALLLLVGGIAKLRRPEAAIRSLASAGLPRTSSVVRLLAAGEAAVGCACLAAPRRATSVALAGSYLGFAWFLSRLRRSSRGTGSCGCLGSTEIPISRLHIGLDLAGAVLGILAVVDPFPGLIPFAGRLPMLAAPVFVSGVALIAYLCYLAVVFLPTLMLSYRRHTTSSEAAPSRSSPFAFHLTAISEEA